MLTAHAPAGYITAKLLYSLKPCHISSKKWAILGAISGLIPDFDMFWFYLVDNGTVHHHRYFTHYPIVWLVILSFALLLRVYKRNAFTSIMLLFAVNGNVHIFLDSIVGDIWLFMPWYDRAYSIFTVPAHYDWWVWNFILHWSFSLELLIWCIAFVFLSKKVA
ncbi:MAG: metal-dependent hydrolase [Pasteurellaceae bacterium]|nr:metal-dependent hydrolase [Pasteurellaceae bacterium]